LAEGEELELGNIFEWPFCTLKSSTNGSGVAGAGPGCADKIFFPPFSFFVFVDFVEGGRGGGVND